MVKPSESNALRQLPLTLLVSQIIDVATDHANLLGIGFLNLEPEGKGWVLSRLAVEMSRWPSTGEHYTLSTWVEDWNPHFSERCFSVVSESGETLGYVRSVWMIIDLNSHRGLGTASLNLDEECIRGKGFCPITRNAKNRPFQPEETRDYTFKFTDLDYYCHVNTVRYISILQNQFSLDFYRTHRLSRFEIAFFHEAKYGETVTIDSHAEAVTVNNSESGEDTTWEAEKIIFRLSTAENQILDSALIFAHS